MIKNMKKVLMMLMVFAGTAVFAQTTIDEERMQRDLEVAENILGTLIKQQYGKRQFFPMEVQASYLPGYGVTFRVPTEMFGKMFFIQDEYCSLLIQAVHEAQKGLYNELEGIYGYKQVR